MRQNSDCIRAENSRSSDEREQKPLKGGDAIDGVSGHRMQILSGWHRACRLKVASLNEISLKNSAEVPEINENTSAKRTNEAWEINCDIAKTISKLQRRSTRETVLVNLKLAEYREKKIMSGRNVIKFLLLESAKHEPSQLTHSRHSEPI